MPQGSTRIRFFRFKQRVIQMLAPLVPARWVLRNPVFVVGCGRSGTTALGRLLAQHPGVVYLNEPRTIWHLDPQTDVWSEGALERGGRLCLDAGHLSPAHAAKIRAAFKARMLKQHGTRMVEKLPANSFRLGYVQALFPDARFVALVRNGLEVARSIQNYIQDPPHAEPWYGKQDEKWHALKQVAQEQGLAERVAWCTNDFLRGLLEWRLSVETMLRDLKELPQDRQMLIRYETFVAAPEEVAQRLMHFMDLPTSKNLLEYAKQNIARKSNVMTKEALPEAEDRVAGDLLRQLRYVSTAISVSGDV